MYRPTLAFSLSDPALSLNCIILFNQPILETQFKIQASSSDLNRRLIENYTLFGSKPVAKKLAVVSKTLSCKWLGSWKTVIACKSTTQ